MAAEDERRSGEDEDGGEDREGRDEIRKLEEADEVPSDPSEWPGGKAKYLTFGGGEDQSDEPFGEGVTGKLGPSDVHHQPDGSVLVQGEKADNPDEFKGDPIPGGPTDLNAPKLAGERDASDDSSEHEDEGDEGSAEHDSADSSEHEHEGEGSGDSVGQKGDEAEATA